ncbi:MAG TPA: nitrate- and nitrite sensing domain-containing protein [Pilimelia sp.]|nr:nitrate- and nitrite sensing domain-containing protein [Pilimelia sp.]
MSTRSWSIRSKITAMLLVPLTTLVVLWAFATSLTIGPALNLLDLQTNREYAILPAQTLVVELQRERVLSLVYLGGRDRVPTLDEQRVRTDTAAATFRALVNTPQVRRTAGELGRRRVAEVLTELDALPAGRSFIDRREVDRPGALGLYNGVVESAIRLTAALAAMDDPQLARSSRTLITLGRAQEVLAQENALVYGAFAAGRFGEGEPSRLVQLIGVQRHLFGEAIGELPTEQRAAYQRMTEGPAFVDLRAMEDRLVARAREGGDVPVDSGRWQSAYDSVADQTRDFEVAQGEAVAAHAREVAFGIFLRLGFAGVLGLLAVGVTALLSVRLGRSLIARLTGLRRAALELAGLRLPAVVARLRGGERVDVAAEAPELEYGNDEIGQVGRAFTEVQRTAVQSAVDEANLRRGLNDVFLNIARRSQTLLHRQLALLDKMERRTTDPDELDDLFRVDHLATRMRRHAEDLVILAGAAPGRVWRQPVPMIDVIRGAVSEVEDYRRVNVVSVEDASVLGRAVGDVIHLLAELIENATSFSPPKTPVRVTGQAVPRGYAVEIEDRGLGMSPEARAAANERLATPPDFDPANSARLGLFVVARLAAKHGVAVRLRPSPYGGVTAVVLIPAELVGPAAAPTPGAPSLPRQGGAAQAGAARVQAGDAVAPDGLHRRARTAAAGVGPVADSRPVADARPRGAVADARPVAPRAGVGGGGPQPVPVGELSRDGLPRRVRQASLAPQLRGALAPATPADDQGPGSRSPEEIRAMMNSFQAGTRRGRGAGARPAAAAPAEGRPTPAAPAEGRPAADREEDA